jgi:exodeoxyribonuclease III
MRLISWNVNGIRALHKKGAFDFFLKEKPDVFVLQETKAESSQCPPEVQNVPGYHAYFASSKVKKGYSGVAVYSKLQPKEVKYGMGIKKFDDEGRLLEVHYDDFVLLNVYFPNGGGGPERLAYKLEFYDAFLAHIENLRKSGKSIVFTGDINTAHEEIDLARPKENEKNTGFLPEERAWLDEVVNHGYIDTFRHFYPKKENAYTYWDMKTAARERNVGWRIDYFFVSNDLVKRIQGAGMFPGVYGSDHCPLYLDLK